MRLSTIFLGLLLATGSAWAEWVQIAENDGEKFYFDPATIREDGNMQRLWEIQDLKQRHKDGVMSMRVRSEYDCKNERFRILSMSTHSEPMARGETLLSGSPNFPWNDIPPGTPSETILKIVCAK